MVLLTRDIRRLVRWSAPTAEGHSQDFGPRRLTLLINGPPDAVEESEERMKGIIYGLAAFLALALAMPVIGALMLLWWNFIGCSGLDGVVHRWC